MTRADEIERVPELTPAQKEMALLHIAASMGGTFDSSDEPWNWLNWFCDDAGDDTDTFNRCNEKGWLFTTHDSDRDISRTVLTAVGRAALEQNQADTAAPAVKAESPWQWWAGSDEEWCTVGPEDSREAIIQAATGDELGECQDDGGTWQLSFHIVEARQDPLRIADWIETYKLLERADENFADGDRRADEHDDGPWFECSPEQEKDLVERIKRACDEWQAAHGLVFTCSTFSHTRNSEHITVDHPANAKAAEGSADAG